MSWLQSFLYDERNPRKLLMVASVVMQCDREPEANHARMADRTEPLTIADIKGVRTGIVICSDAASPNTMWALVNARLELILLSLADDRDEGFFMAKANARLYDAWIVTANRYGNEAGHQWNGHMVISDPLGRLRVAVQEKEQTLVYALQFAGRQSAFKRALRTSLVKLPLGFHILRNWKLARSYF